MWNVFIQILREHIYKEMHLKALKHIHHHNNPNNKYNTLSDKDQILLLHYFLCAQYLSIWPKMIYTAQIYL